MSVGQQPAFHAALDLAANQTAADALRLMMVTGLRVNEARLLQWDYIDLAAATITLPASKTGRSTRPIMPEAVTFLRSRNETTGYVFAGAVSGSPIGGKVLGDTFREACRVAGIAELKVLDLRRTFASDAIAAGVPLLAVQHALGHADLQMVTTVYLKAAQGEISGDELARVTEHRAARQGGKVVDIEDRRRA